MKVAASIEQAIDSVCRAIMHASSHSWQPATVLGYVEAVERLMALYEKTQRPTADPVEAH